MAWQVSSDSGRDLMRTDRAALAADLDVPVLIVQGDQDLQIGTDDARLLAGAAANATQDLLPNVNHGLKTVPANSRLENLASYGYPNQPIAPALVDAIVRFLDGLEQQSQLRLLRRSPPGKDIGLPVMPAGQRFNAIDGP